MCGIAGLLARAEAAPADMEAITRRMSDALTHRGPDGDGHWTDGAAGVSLAHRRLAIIDVSPTGAQPMTSHCGRWVLVYNGEIYNYPDLRRMLETASAPIAWRGTSDTEILLEAVARWGLQGALERSIGMFAIALWDRKERTLHLARDRMGEKPLYYGFVGEDLVFGSELKALREHPRWVGEIDRDAVALLLRYNNIGAPHSIFRGIRKLPPGCILSITPGQMRARELAQPIAWWNLGSVIASARDNRLVLSDIETTYELEALLRDAVRRQMISDVPLGAFLSGGVDSSAIVSLMQTQSPRPVRTFTIGFHEAEMNEAHYAKAVAAHLGTDHSELYVTPQETRKVVPLLPTIYDEPFADPSQIPTFLVSQLARTQVTVVLSGDGGDELFGGYNRYAWAGSIWKVIRHLPHPARRWLARALDAIPPEAANRGLATLRPVLPRGLQTVQLGDKISKLAAIVGVGSPEELYRYLVSQWKSPGDVVIGAGVEGSFAQHAAVRIRSLSEFTEWMMAADAMNYLPDDILVKVDRAAMAVSLESRVPYLDHRVVEFAWRLPISVKIRGSETKWPLRQVLYRQVPRDLLERPKMGFGIPIGHWMRGSMRDWAESLLDESRLRQEGYFRPEPIRKLWSEHLSGRHNWQYPLWNVLMFQSWNEHWQDASRTSRETLAA